MADLLVELIENFVSGAGTTLNSLLSNMFYLVFYIERELAGITLSENGQLFDINIIFQTVFNFALIVLIFLFIKKRD